MIASSHLITGAAIGSSNRKAWIVLPLAFLSHFVLDWIPHSCFNALPKSAWHGAGLVAIIVGAIIECGLCIYALWIAWKLPRRWLAIAAGLAAFLPDPLSYIHPFSNWFELLPGSHWVPWVHTTFHHDVTSTHIVWGFITQVVVMALGICILARKRSEPARAIIAPSEPLA